MGREEGSAVVGEGMRYPSVVFAGGGSRCLWQVGFWEVVSKAMGLFPERVAAVSAGAAMACLIFSGKAEESLARFKDATAQNQRNVYLGNVFTKTPVFPHYAMFRQAVLDTIDPETMEVLHTGPDILVLLSRPPGWMGPRMATVVGIFGYSLEKKLRSPVHPTFGRRIGFRPDVVSVRECSTPSELADLLLASSCTPPFTPLLSWRGKPALDGGFIDNVPVCVLDGVDDAMLVLLSRQYDRVQIPRKEHRTYVQPSRPITISNWDYTNPEGLQETYDLGRADGEAFVQRAGRVV